MTDDLLRMFQSITTNDHESLINQFSKVLQIDRPIASFFLESSNWNVEMAVNTYLATLGNPRPGDGSLSYLQHPPEAAFITDLSAMHTTKFPPNHSIQVMWTFHNKGPQSWPEDTRLVFADGHAFNLPASMPIAAASNAQVDIPVTFMTPATPGVYAGSWRLTCATGYFGDSIWMIVNVDPAMDNQTMMPQAEAGLDEQMNTGSSHVAPPGSCSIVEDSETHDATTSSMEM